MSVMCELCNKMFSKQSNLNRHLLEIHNTGKKVIAYEKSVHIFRCLEEGCNTSYKLNKELRDHLRVAHGHEMQEDILIFNSMQQFQVWLSDIQNSQNVEYVQPKGKSVYKNSEVFYFNCNRHGNTRKIQHQPKRMGRIQGSSKINNACTSQIKLIVKNDGECIAFYHKTHYGHIADIRHLRIPKEDRAAIADKLASGFSIPVILDTYRENFKDEIELKRIHLLSRKDIRSIKSYYQIQTLEDVPHPVDAIDSTPKRGTTLPSKQEVCDLENVIDNKIEFISSDAGNDHKYT